MRPVNIRDEAKWILRYRIQTMKGKRVERITFGRTKTVCVLW